jgi:tricorn protease
MKHVIAGALLALSVCAPALALPNTSDTRMLTEPALSAQHLAFIYAGDVWIANVDGSAPRRLTSDPGEKSNPIFSPDGKLIAYSAQVDGNTDVYLLPVEGGVPKRLTIRAGRGTGLHAGRQGRDVHVAARRLQ